MIVYVQVVGVIAQLGERRVRNAKVVSSNLIHSTCGLSIFQGLEGCLCTVGLRRSP